MKDVKRFEKLLTVEKSALLVIDIQEKILPVIKDYQSVVSNTLKLIRGSKILGLPVFYTEQYPKGLGNTLPEIKNELEEAELFEKMTFSCSGAENLFAKFSELNKTQIIICGIEAHVCVQQTVLDLLSNQFQVNVAADAVSSRKEKDYSVALNRMEEYGAEITTTESILFELLNICGTDKFKQISKLVK
jgi:nicotinamidase-related amidase